MVHKEIGTGCISGKCTRTELLAEIASVCEAQEKWCHCQVEKSQPQTRTNAVCC